MNYKDHAEPIGIILKILNYKDYSDWFGMEGFCAVLTQKHEPDSITDNRRAIVKSLKFDPNKLAYPKQVHSSKVILVNKPAMIEETEGKDLRLVVQTALQIAARHEHEDPSMKSSLQEALTRIAGKSPMRARRLRAWGYRASAPEKEI